MSDALNRDQRLTGMRAITLLHGTLASDADAAGQPPGAHGQPGGACLAYGPIPDTGLFSAGASPVQGPGGVR